MGYEYVICPRSEQRPRQDSNPSVSDSKAHVYSRRNQAKHFSCVKKNRASYMGDSDGAREGLALEVEPGSELGRVETSALQAQGISCAAGAF